MAWPMALMGLLGMAGSVGGGVAGANTQANASGKASEQQALMQLAALRQQQTAYEDSRNLLQPYVTYGNMGLERMLGTGPMTSTMGGGAQHLARQQAPTLMERAKRHLGEEGANRMFAGLIGETGAVSPKDWMTGRRTNLTGDEEDKYNLKKMWNMQTNMPEGFQQPGRPWANWAYGAGGLPTMTNESTEEARKDKKRVPNFFDLPIFDVFPPDKVFEGRAMGGPVEKGEPYMVGENGPEIVMQNKEDILKLIGDLLKRLQKENHEKEFGPENNPFKNRPFDPWQMSVLNPGDVVGRWPTGYRNTAGEPAKPWPGGKTQYGHGELEDYWEFLKQLDSNRKEKEFVGPPEGRAMGGPVRSSQPYMVGENGPEVIVPEKEGTVIPNMTGNLLAGMGAPMAMQGQQMQQGMPGGSSGQIPGGRPMKIAQAIVAAGGQGRPRQIADFMLNQPVPMQGQQMQRGMPSVPMQNQRYGRVGMPGLYAGQGMPPQQATQRIPGAGAGGGFIHNLLKNRAQGMLPGRALGGPVTGGNPYLVGETGPEVVVPNKKPTFSQLKQNLGKKAIQKQLGMLGRKMNPNFQRDVQQTQSGDYGQYSGVANNNYMANMLSDPSYANNPIGSDLYMLDPGMQSFMDWENINNQPATAPQTGILEQGPPDPGVAPTRTPFDFQAYQESPWYQQPLQQGIDAIQRSAIGQGNLYSGGTMEALNKFGQDYAFSKYMPARQQELGESESDFNRWLQGGQFGLNNWLQGTLYPTQEMIRVGQNSANMQANNALSNSEQQANLLSNLGSAQASGTLGQGSAYSGLYNNLGNMSGVLGGYGLERYFG